MLSGVDLDGFKGMSPGNELDKCIGDLRKKVTEDAEIAELGMAGPMAMLARNR